MKYKLLNTEVHKLRDGSPGHDDDAILGKLRSLEVSGVRHLSQMPDFRSLYKRRMKLMWNSPEEGETEYYPWVGNGTMEAAQQHIVAWATFALGAVHACQRMRDGFKDGVDSDWADEEDGNWWLHGRNSYRHKLTDIGNWG